MCVLHPIGMTVIEIFCKDYHCIICGTNYLDLLKSDGWYYRPVLRDILVSVWDHICINMHVVSRSFISNISFATLHFGLSLTHKMPITTIVVCFVVCW